MESKRSQWQHPQVATDPTLGNLHCPGGWCWVGSRAREAATAAGSCFLRWRINVGGVCVDGGGWL